MLNNMKITNVTKKIRCKEHQIQYSFPTFKKIFVIVPDFLITSFKDLSTC